MSRQPLPDPVTGTQLMSVLVFSDHAVITVAPPYYELVRADRADANEGAVMAEALRVLFSYGRNLIDDAFANPPLRRHGFNLPSDHHTGSRDEPLFMFEVHVPDGEPVSLAAANAQIVPMGGAQRMAMHEWNATVGRALIDAAFARALTVHAQSS